MSPGLRVEASGRIPPVVPPSTDRLSADSISHPRGEDLALGGSTSPKYFIEMKFEGGEPYTST